jgi:hypothetical protein
MFNFFSSFKTDVVNAFNALHVRLAAIESKLTVLFNDHVAKETTDTQAAQDPTNNATEQKQD